MIIFDLDGTLADCEHRRHFVDFTKKPFGCLCQPINRICQTCKNWKPDYKSFYEACDKDGYIKEVCQIFDDLAVYNEIEIWSGRCESVRDKTEEWLYENSFYSGQKLKMRPISDNTSDDILKEKWLDEFINSNEWCKRVLINRKCPIDFVFDSDPKSIAMWKRRAVFVFNCCQHDKEF